MSLVTHTLLETTYCVHSVCKWMSVKDYFTILQHAKK